MVVPGKRLEVARVLRRALPVVLVFSLAALLAHRCAGMARLLLIRAPLPTDGQCVSSRSMFPLFFLHTPKTGTSFLTTAYRWGCGIPASNRTFQLRSNGKWTHDKLARQLADTPECHGRLFLHAGNPLTGDLRFYGLAGSDDPDANTIWDPHDKVPFSADHMDHVAQIFRDPASLLVSFFTWGRSNKPGKVDGLPLTLDGFEQWLKIATWEHGMQLRGTYGQRPARPSHPNFETNQSAMFPVARDRLQRTGFVGLTERFNEAVVLFHLMFGGCPHVTQFANMRKTETDGADVDKMLVMAQKAVSWEDAQLYKLATEKFEENAKRFGLYDSRQNPWHDILYAAP